MPLVQVHGDYLLTRKAGYFKLAEHLLEHAVHLSLDIVLSTQWAFFIFFKPMLNALLAE
jgi:hypothetical protein